MQGKKVSSEHIENLSAFDLLGENGIIGKNLDGFKVRKQQIEMFNYVKKTFEDGGKSIIEAPTGVGKTFAYLIPAILHALKYDEKIIISTNTINLQHQITEKDLPFLKQCLGINFSYALAVGRANYLCLTRLKQCLEKRNELFESDKSKKLVEIEKWAKTTKTGLSDEIDFPDRVPDDVWDEICSESGYCSKKTCNYKDECFYQRAKNRLWRSDLIIANHHLLICNLITGGGILPEANFIVIDEAHHLDDVTRRHLGINISKYAITRFLNSLYNPKTQKGLLKAYEYWREVAEVNELMEKTKIFFDEIENWLRKRTNAENKRVNKKNFVNDNISARFQRFSKTLSSLANKIAKENETESPVAMELLSKSEKASAISSSIENFVIQKFDDHCYWIEESQKRTNITLCSVPLDVSNSLNELIFEKFRSVILTSATLSTTQKGDFEYFKKKIGLSNPVELKLDSPFDFKNCVHLFIEKNITPPGEEHTEKYFEDLADNIKKYIIGAEGGIFVLFTSINTMRTIRTILDKFFSENESIVFTQGEDYSRHQILEKFKESRRAVLFGVDSFWEGVDVPGEALETVIITKLPFPVPSEPFAQAYCEKLESEGKDSFYEFSLPEAVIKLRQGFGRLIRRETDKGKVAILDSRIIKKKYGRFFLNALPECRTNII